MLLASEIEGLDMQLTIISDTHGEQEKNRCSLRRGTDSLRRHVHASSGVQVVGDTTYINAAQVNRQYQLRREPYVHVL